MNLCSYCSKPTTNAKFCSRSCSAIASNKTSRKRIAKLTTNCQRCGISYLVRGWRKSRCQECFALYGNQIQESRRAKTLGSIKQVAKEKGIHPSWAFSEVRSNCRAKNGHRPKRCEVCGYETHIEYCHIKAVSTWPDTATMDEVNDPSNVVILCRNHHWEFDHGLLDLRHGRDSNPRVSG